MQGSNARGEAAGLGAPDREALRACAPIRALSAADRQAVVAAAGVSAVEAGEVIVRQGDAGDAFFVVLGGRLAVSRTERDGREVELMELESGAYFGELALRSGGPGRRTATVRALVASRLATVPARVFAERIEAARENREAFERDAATYLYRELRRSLESFGEGALGESVVGINRRRYAAGDTVITEGEPSDAAFLVTGGVALAVHGRGDTRRELTRFASGQVFGELGVLEGTARTATVVAETDLDVLRIESAAFLAWHESHPRLGGLVDSLTDVYELAEGRRVSVFRGRIEGEDAVTTVRGGPTDGVVSTRLVGRGVVVFANAAAAALEGDRETVRFETAGAKRELRLVVTERAGERIERARMHALSAEGIDSDLGTLYQSVVALQEVTGLELRRFQSTGFLGGEAPRSDGLCLCLGLGREDVSRAAAEVGAELEALRINFGVAALCGGCEPAVRAFLEEFGSGSEPESAAGCQLESALRREPEGSHRREPSAEDPDSVALDEDERWLRDLLSAWDGDGDGDGRVRREEVMIRLRGLGTEDLDGFVNALFGDDLSPGASVSIDRLAASLSRSGLGFSGARRRPNEAAGVEKLALGALRLVRRHAGLARFLAVLFAIAFAGALAWLAWAGGPTGLALLGLGAAAVALVMTRPSVRFLGLIALRGLGPFHAAVHEVYGRETRFARLRTAGPLGPPTFLLRDEAMIDHVLHAPEVYRRNTMIGYSPFGLHSVLGGGSGGEWLGYRSLCEEYFVEGYRDDLEEIAGIARARVASWPARGEIDLLDEIYRIVIEVRARVFFQTSFGCFEDAASVDMAGLIDRVLTWPLAVLGDETGDDVRVLHDRILAAVQGSSRAGSVGAILREALESGRLEEREVIENATMYVLAQAPVMGIFWTLYRAARDGTQMALREDRLALGRALKEELRLHPPVNLLVTRVAARDDRIGDVAVPKGSVMMISPFFVHGNPAQWTEPQRFRPERWSIDRGDGREIVEPHTDGDDAAGRPCPHAQGQPARRYLPFGAGAQACQGRWFASDEMLTVLRVALDEVELEVVDDGGLLDRPLREQVVLHVYNRPVRDVRMRARARSATR